MDMETLMPYIIEYGSRIAMAVLVLVIGFIIAGWASKLASRTMEKRGVDPSLRPFLVSIVSTLLKIMVVITALTTLGVEMTSFVALLGAAGLAVGMALSGTLQNFAGGTMILIFKPFKVGDVVEAQGYTGKVSEIQIFNTIMKTPDNKTIIIPNGGLSTGSMVNYSTEEKRRVDFTFGIGYDDDIDKAKEVMMRVIKADSRVINDPAEPFIGLAELADSSVNFTVRVWAMAGDYWGVFFDLQETMKKEFDKESISIPYPQTDVHLHQS